MAALPPSICTELATQAYVIKKADRRGRFPLVTSMTLDNYFTFDLSNGPIKGISGGAVAHAKGVQTGFVLVGHGNSPIGRSNPYKNDLVLAIRGTNSIYDTSTDLRANISLTEFGARVHSGFNSLFITLQAELAPYLSTVKSGGTVHCIGHSLGGAVASLVADWAKKRFNCKVKLYTFGAPKVGLHDFALKTTNALEPENIYRCVNGGDVVPMVPVWPFIHAPYNAHEYRLDNHKLLRPWHHLMKYYTENCKAQSWDGINKEISFNSFRRVTLSVQNAQQVQSSVYWMNRLSEALITVLREANLALLNSIQSGVANGLNLYDKIAMILADKSLHAMDISSQLSGLLACMLKFAGYGSHKIKELTTEFIRWVFERTLNMINKLAREALKTTEH